MALTSLYAGISGLNVNSDAISLIGNNIANSNTIGFKSGRIQFKDIVSSSLGGGTAGQIGRGATTGGISTLFTQSSFETTTRGTDLAIDGDGFFVVADDGVDYYTRAGDFIFDKDGLMVNSSGLAVQGWKVDDEGKTTGDISDINVSDVSSSSKPSTAVGLGANLDSTSEAKFVLNDYNGRFVMEVAGTDVVVNLSGTFTGSTLASQLENVVQTNVDFVTAMGAASPSDFTVSYSDVTGKFSFTNSSAVDMQFKFTNASGNVPADDFTMNEILGMEIKDRDADNIVDNINLLSGTQFTSDILPRLSDRLFYVNDNNNSLVFSIGNDEFQAIIPVSADPYDTHFYIDGAGNKVPSGSSIAQQLADSLNNATDTSGGGAAVGTTTTFSVEYDDITGKLSIIATAVSGTDDIRFKWEDDRTSAEQLLGFASDFDPDNVTTATSFKISGNNGSVESVFPPNTIFDPTAANYSTAMNIYDTLGSPHTITAYFKKLASNVWEYHIAAESTDLDNGIPNSDGSASLMEVGPGGILEFNPNGSLKSETNNNNLFFNFSGGSDLMQVIDVDFGNSTTEGGSGLDGTTQYANASATFSQTQDGFPAGSLSGVSISSDGMISGIFTNGEIKDLAQLALAMFESPWGLNKKGNNIWAETLSSGNVSIGLPGTAGRGTVASNSLEQSNVDIATEFVKMIAAQRAFQANAKMITTSDELLSEVVNLKR